MPESSPPPRKSDLPPASQTLIERMSRLGYGSLEHVVIEGGAPVLDGLRAIRDVKLGADRQVAHYEPPNDFPLKRCVIELLAEFVALENGTIDRIEVRDGLPVRVIRSIDL